MRVLILCDMEGISGITVWEQVTGGSALYEEGRRLYTADVNAVVRGCKRAGAKQITVVDWHGAGGFYSFKSLIPEKLERGARYVLGAPYLRYTEPLEHGCDVALFVGFHSMAGTPDGVLCHTVSAEQWVSATLNGQPAGEVALAAAFCGEWNVPVAFISGDESACREAKTLLGESLYTVAVKKGIGRFAAVHLAPEDAHALLEETACSALTSGAKFSVFRPSPVTLKVQLHTPDAAQAYVGKPGIELEDARTVVAQGNTFWEVWDRFWKR